jgi:hypothetical protein
MGEGSLLKNPPRSHLLKIELVCYKYPELYLPVDTTLTTLTFLTEREGQEKKIKFFLIQKSSYIRATLS